MRIPGVESITERHREGNPPIVYDEGWDGS